jgi:NADH-quinone oxidoreductase subunit N
MALRQKNLYRLMAYSSIAHAGYMLVGLAVGNVGAVGGTTAVLFYLAAYGFMTIGVFALLRGAGSGEQSLETIDDLRGLSYAHPATAVLLAVCLLSLTGLPPTAGFWGKLNLFFAAWGETTAVGHWLATLLAVNAAIAAFYYLRLVAVMYLEPSASRASRSIDAAAWVGGLACTVATLLLFAQPQWLWDAVERATG